MELESSTQNVVLSLSTSPHMDEENIFLGEAYRFIRIPVNQKYSTTHVKERAAELLNSEPQSRSKFMALENTKTDFSQI
jgi:hypothetical protein